MELAYISGPYRDPSIHGIVRNIRRAEEAATKYRKLKYAVFCPHMNSALMDGTMPDDYWMHEDLEILCRCDAIVMLSDWELSEGARIEHQKANEWGLTVIYD